MHKWESNVAPLESKNMPNPGKILGHNWDKREDTLEIQLQISQEEAPLTKKSILSHLGKVYDPLGITSPTMVEGKRIYRDACDEKKGWNAAVSTPLRNQWLKWTKQLKNVIVPRSIARNVTQTRAIHLHVFADACNLACCAATIAIIENESGVIKGLLTSKSRISKRGTTIARLELISGHMAANLAQNICRTLEEWPVETVTIWMDSMVALYWILNPGKSWKVFVANRVRKLAQITENIGIQWKYCPTERNLADLGSRGASLNRMEKGEWYEGPQWLLTNQDWPEQPNIKCSSRSQEEEKPVKELMAYTKEENPADEWDELLARQPYWKVLRATDWALRFKGNSLSKSQRVKKTSGPLRTAELVSARIHWVRRAQRGVLENMEKPGWKLAKEKETGVLKCVGRIPGYNPTYLENGLFAQKLIQHVHLEVKHLGVASTMSELREEWWIPKLRSLVKKQIRQCNVCKVFAAKPCGTATTSALPEFRTEVSRPFQYTGVDFAGPLKYKVNKNENKAYVLIFTCATSRAVHLELTRSQTADEFQRKLNAFITRRTRPQLIISDNAATFKATAAWIRKVKKGERLQDFLAKQ